MKELYQKWKEYEKQVEILINGLLEENNKLKKEKKLLQMQYEQALKDYDKLLQKNIYQC